MLSEILTWEVCEVFYLLYEITDLGVFYELYWSIDTELWEVLLIVGIVLGVQKLIKVIKGKFWIKK